MKINTPEYKEFDDIIIDGNLVSSKKAYREILNIMYKYNLRSLMNPAGAELECIDDRHPFYGFRCQVYQYDDIEDLNKLRKEVDLYLEKLKQSTKKDNLYCRFCRNNVRATEISNEISFEKVYLSFVCDKCGNKQDYLINANQFYKFINLHKILY